MKYQWLLFDADGTLFEYDRAEAEALQRTFEQFGCPFEPGYAEAYRRINGDIWLAFEQGEITQTRLRTERFERLFGAVGVNLEAASFSAQYLQNLAEGTYLVDGAAEVVQALYGRVGLALITNGLRDVQRPRFARSAIGKYFSRLVISEEVGAAKPDPQIFEVAFQQMGWPHKQDVLMIGDSLSSDMKGGSDYGIDTCWFNPAGKPRELDVEVRYEIADLRELLPLVAAG
jgi:2-haloacid dehalogenase